MTNRDSKAEAETDHLMMTLLRESEQLRRILDLREYEAADETRPYDQALHSAAHRLLDPVGKITVRMATEAANRGMYHWTLTLSGMVDGRQTLVGEQGLIPVAADETRESICNKLIASLTAGVQKKSGHPFRDAKVLFFDLQPNVIS
ncbi:hypothetical protein [Streptomyces sp. NBC_01353]|uniref:hypothetical protein n=1 Tax=Streptomyces sp. NBC_01353 TaxID=2903835 RepID=UPI002E2F2DBA|nr:hypothetical protein [Streptomyces sp. NBC_01353]